MYVFIVLATVAFGVLVKTLNADVIVYTQFSNQVIEEFRDLPARFGAPIPINGMKVLAIESNPADGCASIDPPPKNHSNNVKWAVLIARYNCSFEEKVRYAQTAGYGAAIVYNVNSNDLEQMSANNDEGIVIPSIFVGETTGKIIIYNYQFFDQFALVINDDLPFNINTHLILPFTIVVGLCFLIMIGFMVVKCVREQRRLRRHRLPSSVLKKIPCIRFSKGQQSESYETCAICLDDYVDGDKLRILPCSHAYHCKCIDPWLTKNRRVCPICKRKVFARGEPRRRARRSSDDSSSDSDGDDRTPLLNPVDHANHGTFPRPATGVGAAASSSEDGQQSSGGTVPRQNPFDRSPHIAVNVDVFNRPLNIWERFLRVLVRADPQQLDLQPHETDGDDTNTINSTDVIIDNDLSTTTRSTSMSNNILNQNLSGSLRAPVRVGGDVNSYEDDYSNSHSTIYQPIAMEPQPQSAPPLSASQQRLPNRNAHQYQPLSNSRLGVAAIPNTNFNVAANDATYATSSRNNRDNTQPQAERSSPAASEKFFV